MAFGIESKIRKKKAKAKANGAVRGACRLLCEVHEVVWCSSAERGPRLCYNAWRCVLRAGTVAQDGEEARQSKKLKRAPGTWRERR